MISPRALNLTVVPLVIFLSFVMVNSCLADTYNTDYCYDPAQLRQWENMLKDNPDSESLAAIHALWIGLCVKVEAQQLTTSQANRIFDHFRDALIDQIRQQEEIPPDRKPI